MKKMSKVPAAIIAVLCIITYLLSLLEFILSNWECGTLFFALSVSEMLALIPLSAKSNLSVDDVKKMVPVAKSAASIINRLADANP